MLLAKISTADPGRSDLCTSKIGPCNTFYTPECICVGKQIVVPYFSLSWNVRIFRWVETLY